jgi:hypothetical protein
MPTPCPLPSFTRAPRFEVEPGAAEWQTLAGAKRPGQHKGVPCALDGEPTQPRVVADVV